MAVAPEDRPASQTPGAQATTQRSAEMSDDEVMKIRKQAGSIAEVIEPVQRVRAERTN